MRVMLLNTFPVMTKCIALLSLTLWSRAACVRLCADTHKSRRHTHQGAPAGNGFLQVILPPAIWQSEITV